MNVNVDDNKNGKRLVLPKRESISDEVTKQLVDILNQQTEFFRKFHKAFTPEVFRIPAPTSVKGSFEPILDGIQGVIDSVFPQQTAVATNIHLKIDNMFDVAFQIVANGPPVTTMQLKFDSRISIVSLDQPVLLCGRVFER